MSDTSSFRSASMLDQQAADGTVKGELMKVSAIRAHLRPNAIQHRLSVAHEFAHAMLPHEAYDETRVRDAVRGLGMDPDQLTCVYCGGEPTTWDHLIGLVEAREPRGPGNQLCNLVPSCGPCNQQKGGGDWRSFVQTSTRVPDDRRAQVESILDTHIRTHSGAAFDLDESFFLEARELRRNRDLIVQLLVESQSLAVELREKQQRLLWPATSSVHAVMKEKAVDAGRQEQDDDAYQAFYELVFERMATDPGRVKPGPRSWQPLRSSRWGAFWIYFKGVEVLVCANLRVAGAADAKAATKALFDRLQVEASVLQSGIGPDRPLRWERLDNKIACRVGLAISKPDFAQPGALDATVAWAADALDRMVVLLEPRLDALVQELPR